MTAQTSNYHLGDILGEQGRFPKNGSQLLKVYMVSLELGINISPEAGGIKFFEGSIVKESSWGWGGRLFSSISCVSRFINN